ncbi:hypothetical protein DOS84_17570 [Flavobacterium aquariorum]|uniref:Uncharacterized protein n=1 Tax=Flavobacterium aquariorum TaxID=2217670 RepID=A0A2W7TPX5_9FLAO|nr:hypothetical protein [Flavobacterium aquariorum]PZX92108.1 hypothetical protein DOS84_17570 [Flavobacterium aquariorum]
MKEPEKQLGNNSLKQKKEDKNQLPDSLLYPPEEDIYRKFHKESEIDPEDISKKKVPVEINNISELNQKEFDEDMSGGDLDIPGLEFDDEQLSTTDEDEENSHYSIGGDDHNNLEENI